MTYYTIRNRHYLVTSLYQRMLIALMEFLAKRFIAASVEIEVATSEPSDHDIIMAGYYKLVSLQAQNIANGKPE